MKKFCIQLFLLYSLALMGWAQEPTNGSGQQTVTKQVVLPVFTLFPAPATRANIAQVGNPGPASACYWMVTNYTLGQSAVEPAGQNNCPQSLPNTLSASNYMTITPVYPAGIASIDLLKTSTPTPPSGACNCAVATGVTSGTINDQSNSTSSYTVSTVNPGGFTLALTNEVTGTGVTSLLLRNYQTGALIANLSLSGGGITGATAGGGLVVTGTTLGLLTTCTSNQLLQWNGSAWVCATISSGISGSGTANTIPLWTGSTALGNSPLSVSSNVILSGDPISVNTTAAGSYALTGISNTTGCAGSSETGWSTTGVGCAGGFLAVNANATAASIVAGGYGEGSNASAPTAGTPLVTGLYGLGIDDSSTSFRPAWVAGVVGAIKLNSGSSSALPVASGVVGVVNTNASGPITLVSVIDASLILPQNGPTVTLAAAFYAHSPSLLGTSTLTHNYGLYLEDQTTAGAGTLSDSWGIYEVAGKNFLGGNLTLGYLTSAGNQCLQVNSAGLIGGTGGACSAGQITTPMTIGQAIVAQSTTVAVSTPSIVDNTQGGGNGVTVAAPFTIGTSTSGSAFQWEISAIPTASLALTGANVLAFGFDTTANDASNSLWRVTGGGKFKIFDSNNLTLDLVGNAALAKTFAQGNLPLTFTFDVTTSGDNGIVFTESTASSGGLAANGLVYISTLTGSTESPIYILQGAGSLANPNPPAAVNFIGGAGYSQVGSSGNGGTGSSWNTDQGAGGNGGSASGNGGNGGDWLHTTGAGGNSPAASGGRGGNINWTLSSGGTGGTTQGAPGMFELTQSLGGGNTTPMMNLTEAVLNTTGAWQGFIYGRVTTNTASGTGSKLIDLGLTSSEFSVDKGGNLALGLIGTNTATILLSSSGAGGSNTITPGTITSAYTTTLPANSGTVAELNLAQTWTAAQTFSASDLQVLGSSTGVTTIASLNASGTNYTANLPANTGNLSELNFAATWTANQTFNGHIITGVPAAKTSAYTGNSTADSGNLIRMNCSGACAYTMNGSPGAGYYGYVMSTGSTLATISLNSLTFNGSSTVPLLATNEPLFFWSDGTNYFGVAPSSWTPANTVGAGGIWDNGAPLSNGNYSGSTGAVSANDLHLKQLVVDVPTYVGHVLVDVTANVASTNFSYCAYDAGAPGSLSSSSALTLVFSATASSASNGVLNMAVSSPQYLLPGHIYYVGGGDDGAVTYETYGTNAAGPISSILNASVTNVGRIPGGAQTGGGCVTGDTIASISAGSYIGQQIATALRP